MPEKLASLRCVTLFQIVPSEVARISRQMPSRARAERLQRLTEHQLMIAFDENYRDFDEDLDTDRMIRVSRGDRQAFDELISQNFASTVRIIAAMLGSYSRAEDLAQEVFMRVFRSRERYLPTAKFSTFLGTVIRNAVLNEKRRLSRQRVSTTEFADGVARNGSDTETTQAPAYEIDLAGCIDRQQTRRMVSQALADLPSRQRQAIELVHFSGMTYVGAAKEMETSRKAVKSLLGRGRQALSETLQEHFESSQ